MNTSAKITTGTFLAAMALGAASLVACTVNSTSSTDTDGGTSSSGGSSSGTTSSSGGSSGTTDDGGSSGDGGTCDSTSQTTKYPAACQSCTETSCSYCLSGYAFADSSEKACTKVRGAVVVGVGTSSYG